MSQQIEETTPLQRWKTSKAKDEPKSYTTYHMHRYYIQKYGWGNLYSVHRKLYAEILDEYNKYIMDLVINKAYEFVMPSGLGVIVVVKKCRIKYPGHLKYSVDFNESRKAGKTIYHLNEHSGNYKYRFMWYRDTYRYNMIKEYRLDMCRGAKRTLASAIKNKITDYIQK